jgi:serine/threonine-protein kinase
VLKQLQPSSNSVYVLQMARDLFEREAQTLGRIGNHPQVPRLLDYFEADQQFFLVQEYVAGATLQQEIKKNGPFTEASVKQLLSELLPILDYVHNHQVIHRDIKPANLIRRTHDRKLVLIDFGAVKNHTGAMVDNASEHTVFTAYAVGTPGFAPPEQMAMRPVFASDIYSLGVTCVYLLTGKSPKDLSYDPATGELMWRQKTNVSEHFAQVLGKMLEVSVRHRFQTAQEVLHALELEPYLDSLASSLNSVSIRSDSPSQGKPQSALSPTQRAALAIRSRYPQPESPHGPAGKMRPQLMGARPSPTAARKPDPTGKTGHSLRAPRAPRATAPVVEQTSASSRHVNAAPSTHRLDSAAVLRSYGQGERNFSAYNLEALRLIRANLAGAVFHRANLRKSNLRGANLTGADLGRANLYRVNLRNANLSRAYLSNADLQEGDLRGADLRGAYLLNANLRGTNLCGANLSGAKLSPEQLAMARTNWLTVKPNGRRWG